MTTATSTSTTPDTHGDPATPEAITIPQNSAPPQDDRSRAGEPEGEKSIAEMRAEIDEIDAELVRLIQRRSPAKGCQPSSSAKSLRSCRRCLARRRA